MHMDCGGREACTWIGVGCLAEGSLWVRLCCWELHRRQQLLGGIALPRVGSPCGAGAPFEQRWIRAAMFECRITAYLVCCGGALCSWGGILHRIMIPDIGTGFELELQLLLSQVHRPGQGSIRAGQHKGRTRYNRA